MKIFSVLLALTLATQAAPSDPGQVAIAFLEKVRDRKLNLEPGGDTALSAQTSEVKRRQIARQLERLAHDLGSDPLEIGAVKLDENYAAVLVRKLGGFDPSRLRVFPIALVKRNKEWEVAPVPASFENAGAGYALALRERIKQLENWMLREQVTDLEKLREQSNAQMRRKIEASLPEGQLRSFDAQMMGEKFLAACEARDLATALGLLGGLEEKLPDDWTLRIRSAENALGSGSNAEWPWRLLVAPDIARTIVHHEADAETGTVGIGCLDPTKDDDAPPAIQIVYLSLEKSNSGLWRIDPSAEFFQPSKNPPVSTQPQNLENSADSEWVQKFPTSWANKYPSISQPTAELANRAWLTSLRSGKFSSLLAITKLDSDPHAAVKACIHAAQAWRETRGGSLADFIAPLAFRVEDNHAAAIYQFSTARESDKFTPRSVHFEKSASGWLWTPEPSAATHQATKTWLDDETKRLAEVWQQQLLAGCPKITSFATLVPATEEETRACVESWLKAVHQGNAEEALQWVAHLESPRSGAIALQNLGYEITASRKLPSPTPITSVYLGKIWSAASTQIEHELGKPIFPFYPVVNTPAGPRVLIEIDLIASGNRSRDYLNNAAFARLTKSTTDDAASDLKSVFQDHLTKTGKLTK